MRVKPFRTRYVVSGALDHRCLGRRTGCVSGDEVVFPDKRWKPLLTLPMMLFVRYGVARCAGNENSLLFLEQG